MKLDEKINKVKEILKDKNIVIAFSGGSDSTLLASIASKVSKKVLAVTVDNGIMPNDFIKNSAKIAENLGVEHKIIQTNMLNLEGFKNNNSNRCYICRKSMYNSIITISKEINADFVVDGNNISDLLEDRPGILVKFENSIVSPLIECEIENKDVIKYLKNNNIEYSKSTTCLATRIKIDTPLNRKNINRVNYSENLIKNLTKSEIVKVRDIGDNTAEIEIRDLDSILNPNKIKMIGSELKAVNFKKILLNIDSEKKEREIIEYKPCKEVNGKTMVENQLPYNINLKETKLNLKDFEKIKYSENIGVIMIEDEGKNISIFKNGKIVVRRANDLNDGKKTFIKILPKIRRSI